jgi:hypothetical protein
MHLLVTDMERSIQKQQDINAFIQNALKLYEVVKDVLLPSLQAFETDLITKLQQESEQLLHFASGIDSNRNNHESFNGMQRGPYDIVNNFVLVTAKKTPDRVKQVVNFLRSVQEVNMPLLSVASKNFQANLDSAKQLVHKSLFHKISTALQQFSIRFEKLEEDSDSDSEEEDTLHLQSFVASEYMSTIEGHLVDLVRQLDTLSSVDENRYWLDRICKDATENLQKAVTKLLRDLLNKKPARLPSEPKRNKQSIEPGILTPYGMKQILCDYNAFRNVLNMLYHQPSDEQKEFIDIIVKVFQLDTFKEQQNELAHFPVKHSVGFVNILRELLKRSYEYGYLK